MTRSNQLVLLIAISIVYVTAKPCDIIENMACECHASFNGETEQLMCNNHKTPVVSSIILANETVKTGRSFDSFHFIFYDHEFNVSSMFLSQLSYVYPRSSSIGRGEQKLAIKIILSFHNFNQLHFEDYAFYQLFGHNSHFKTILTLELTSNGQITFSPRAFSQLNVDQMFLHASSLEPYSFEEIFNNTNIGELTIEGSIPVSNNTLQQDFDGKIRTAKFTKMVESITNEEFPSYPVRSLNIEAHEARRINASTFVNYRNLHGLHLIRPKFAFDNRSFDGFQYVVSLDLIEIDSDTIKDNTFQHTPRIGYLTLGPNTRYLSDHALDHLDYLVQFDASKLVLDQLYPSSKCVLARFIAKQKKLNPSMVILPPQAEYCDCIYDFILAILKKEPSQFYNDSCADTQQERCQLSACDVARNFYLSSQDDTNNEAGLSDVDESMKDGMKSSNPVDDGTIEAHPMPKYVHRLPPVQHQSESNKKGHHTGSADTDIKDSHVSALKADKPIDPNSILADDYDEVIVTTAKVHAAPVTNNAMDEERRIALRNETLKWITISLICITILCILLVVTIIWFFTCRPSKHAKEGFQPVHPAATNV